MFERATAPAEVGALHPLSAGAHTFVAGFRICSTLPGSEFDFRGVYLAYD